MSDKAEITSSWIGVILSAIGLFGTFIGYSMTSWVKSYVQKAIDDAVTELEFSQSEHRKEIHRKIDENKRELQEFKSSYDKEVTMLSVMQKTTSTHIEKLEFTVEKMDNKLDSVLATIQQFIRDYNRHGNS